MQTEEASKLRAVAEGAILATLQKLSRDTGLDIAKVEVMLVVHATVNGDPRRLAEAVRIELCV